MAEVLITLGIIGVIAALTIPGLVTNFQKIRVETSLKKFYTTINQALRSYVAENGDIYDIGVTSGNYNKNVEFLKTYILPYMKYMAIDKCVSSSQSIACVTLINGDMFAIDGIDINYFPEGKWVSDKSINPRKRFMFQLYTTESPNCNNSKNNFVEPYVHSWDCKMNSLYNNNRYGCSKNAYGNYCVKIIQLNNWKIPDNYPW